MYNILVCDDEQDIVNALKIYLSADGYNIFEAHTGREALRLVSTEEIHLILMDIMMPEMDGITAMTNLRKEYNIPVILLTAKSEDVDKILGLNVGADDYITKPFNPVELSARVRSQLRRYMQLGGNRQSEHPSVISVGNIEMNEKAHEVRIDGELILLTPTEYDILKLFMQHAGEVLSSKEIYRKVWHDEPYGAENTVAVHIRHLREKLEINPAQPQYLMVVWAQGYKLEGGSEK